MKFYNGGVVASKRAGFIWVRVPWNTDPLPRKSPFEEALLPSAWRPPVTPVEMCGFHWSGGVCKCILPKHDGCHECAHGLFA